MIADDMAKFFVRISTDFDPLEYWSIRINNKASLSIAKGSSFVEFNYSDSILFLLFEARVRASILSHVKQYPAGSDAACLNAGDDKLRYDLGALQLPTGTIGGRNTVNFDAKIFN